MLDVEFSSDGSAKLPFLSGTNRYGSFFDECSGFSASSSCSSASILAFLFSFGLWCLFMEDVIENGNVGGGRSAFCGATEGAVL